MRLAWTHWMASVWRQTSSLSDVLVVFVGVRKVEGWYCNRARDLGARMKENYRVLRYHQIRIQDPPLANSLMTLFSIVPGHPLQMG